MRILIATEGSRFSEAAIDKCCELLAEVREAEVRIVSAVEPTYVAAAPFAVIPHYNAEIIAASEKAAEIAAAKAKAKILDRLPRFIGKVTSKVDVGTAEQVIVDEAENWGADLVVVGSHGYGFWERALLGSVSNHVVHHAPCSVLVVRPPRSTNGRSSD